MGTARGNESVGEKATLGRILLVDDDRGLLELLRMWLESVGHEVQALACAEKAIKALRTQHFDVVISDLRMGAVDGMAVLGAVKALQRSLPVIIITAHGSIPGAVQAMRNGAHHYLTKPFANQDLENLVSEVLRHGAAPQKRESLSQHVEQGKHLGYIFKSEMMAGFVEELTRFARSDANIFLTGESGAGKELAARNIHGLSAYADGPFLALNCGAIPQDLLESELFGHVKGAFTGASTRREGLFSRANGGTILLDEIGDLPPSLQVKLLRVLQERRIRPVGANTEIPIDVRLISATHRDIQAMVVQGAFREDLYYRLHVIPIHVPSLHERREDIPLLAQGFLDEVLSRLGGGARGFTRAAMEKLVTRPWPGNIRELKNVVEYLAACTDEGWIEADLIPEPLRASDEDGKLAQLTEARVSFERDYLQHLMCVTSGNVAQAARIAGRYRADLYKLLRKHGIEAAIYKTV